MKHIQIEKERDALSKALLFNCVVNVEYRYGWRCAQNGAFECRETKRYITGIILTLDNGKQVSLNPHTENGCGECNSDGSNENYIDFHVRDMEPKK